MPTSSVDSPRSSPICRSEEHTSELQSQSKLVCRLLLEKKKPHVLEPRVGGDPPGGLQPVHLGHPHVHENDVRQQLHAEPHALAAVACLAHALDALHGSH